MSAHTVVHPHGGILFSHEKSEAPIPAATQTNPDDTELSKGNPTRKATQCMAPVI